MGKIRVNAVKAGSETSRIFKSFASLFRADVPLRLSGACGTRKPGRILVVDDDAIIRKTAALKLKSAGHEVITAADASEAIQAVGRDKPDVVLMDLQFPPDISNGGLDWDGFRLMHWLRGLEGAARTRFIVITGEQSVEYEVRALESGAAGFLRKPISYEKLLRLIQTAGGNSSGSA